MGLLSGCVRCLLRGNSWSGGPALMSTSAALGGLDRNVLRSPYSDINAPGGQVNNYLDFISKRSSAWSHRTAVECGVTGECYSYEELWERSYDIGVGLKSIGVLDDVADRMAFLQFNAPQYLASLLGVASVGGTACSINPLYTVDEIAYQLKSSGAKGIITFPERVGDALKAAERLKSEGVLSSDFQVISTSNKDRNEIKLPGNVQCLEDIRLKGRSKSGLTGTSRSNGGGRSLAFISHSSGTTGLPKGVCLSHENVLVSILQASHPGVGLFRETTDSHQDVIPLVLPMFHNFGLEIALCALYNGSKLVTIPKFEEKLFLKTMKEHKGSLLFAVPPMIFQLGQSTEARPEHLASLRTIMGAAAPIGDKDIHRCLTKCPEHVNFIQGYGQTEAMCCVTLTPCHVRNYSSVGVPVANTLVKIRNLESGETNPQFEQGEICYKGPQTCLGYLNNPAATAESLDPEGWFRTGDIGYFDSNGYLYIVDRIKELIKVKGFQVAPAELEALLRSHPGVKDAGVIGSPDLRRGEVPVAFIQLKKNSNQEVIKSTQKDLQDFIEQRVAPFKKIHKYIFVESIPKSPSGKILRRELKLMLNNKND